MDGAVAALLAAVANISSPSSSSSSLVPRPSGRDTVPAGTFRVFSASQIGHNLLCHISSVFIGKRFKELGKKSLKKWKTLKKLETIKKK